MLQGLLVESSRVENEVIVHDDSFAAYYTVFTTQHMIQISLTSVILLSLETNSPLPIWQ